VVPIGLAEGLFGVPGPNWVSPTGAAALLGRTGIETVPPSWLSALPTPAGSDKGLASMKVWTRLAFLQVFINVVNDASLAGLARQAVAELMRHIEWCIAQARSMPRGDETLLHCLVALGDNPWQFNLDQSAYDRHMRLILAELVVGGVETVNKALTNVVDFALDRPDVLAELHAAAREANDERIDALVREALRFAPVSPVLFRVAGRATTIGTEKVPEGTVVCLLVDAALRDRDAFPDPNRFDFERTAEPYLHFGDTQPGPALHRCLGQKLATAELRELVRVVFSLKGLRRAAGRAGEKLEEQLLPTPREGGASPARLLRRGPVAARLDPPRPIREAELIEFSAGDLRPATCLRVVPLLTGASSQAGLAVGRERPEPPRLGRRERQLVSFARAGYVAVTQTKVALQLLRVGVVHNLLASLGETGCVPKFLIRGGPLACSVLRLGEREAQVNPGVLPAAPICLPLHRVGEHRHGLGRAFRAEQRQPEPCDDDRVKREHLRGTAEPERVLEDWDSCAAIADPEVIQPKPHLDDHTRERLIDGLQDSLAFAESAQSLIKFAEFD
jgi:hypothetical protein